MPALAETAVGRPFAGPAQPGNIQLRAARPDDADWLASFENGVFPSDRISLRSFRRLISQPGDALVIAEADGTEVGYALALFRRGLKVARLYSIAIAGTRRGQGIGRALLEALEDIACQRGAAAMRLEVRQDDEQATAFYQALGYVPIGTREDYYEDGGDALRMEKRLGQATAKGARRP
jgi:ribosomal-protein-alanine acetyltransferase